MDNIDITKYAFFKQLINLSFIDKIYLFGSRAKNNNNPRSDIDLAIFCPNATQDQWLQVVEIIENADTLLKIDYTRFDKLQDDNQFKKSIIANNKIIFSRV